MNECVLEFSQEELTNRLNNFKDVRYSKLESYLSCGFNEVNKINELDSLQQEDVIKRIELMALVDSIYKDKFLESKFISNKFYYINSNMNHFTENNREKFEITFYKIFKSFEEMEKLLSNDIPN